MTSSIENAVAAGDVQRIARLLAEGVDPNTLTAFGDCLLSLAASSHLTNPHPGLTVRLLLERGADPNGRGELAPLVTAIFNTRPEIVQLLLKHGANPNTVVGGVETIYDLAEFDYRFEQYDLHLPEEPTEADDADEDSWLAMLDRFALKYRKRMPIELHILRSHGALTMTELRARKETA